MLTLALGTAFSTAVFGIVRSIKARVVPPVDLSHLWTIRVSDTMKGWDQLGLPVREFERMAPPLAGAGIITALSDPNGQFPVSAAGRAETLQIEAVSGNYARLLDLRPAAGRWLDAADDAGAGQAVAVISARLWRDWFASNPDAIGRQSIHLQGVRFGIVGVAAEDFRGVIPGVSASEVWIPERALPNVYPPKRDPRWFQDHLVTILLRASAHVTPAELQTRLTTALAGGALARDPHRFKANIERASALDADVDRRGLMVLMLGLLVLAAACANVANLMYARGSEIRGELAVRRSLGATRAQLVHVLLSEALLIGVAASVLGCAGAIGAMRAFGTLFPMFLVDRFHYTSLALSPDWQLFVYAIICGTLAAAAMGIVTGLSASRSVPAMDLWSGGVARPARDRMRTVLAAVQVTAAMLLAMLTGLVIENAPADLSTRIMYDTQPLTVAGVDLEPYGYNRTTAAVFFARLLASANTLPGVERAALASAVPGGVGKEAPDIIWLVAPTRNNVSGATRRITASSVGVSPTYFDTAGIRLERGRAFTQADGYGAPLTAILSRSAAEVLFPRRDPLGSIVTYGFQGPSLIVVGIVDDPVTGPSEQAPFAQPSNVVFWPLTQRQPLAATLFVRAPSGSSLAEPLRGAVRAIDDRVGLFEPARVSESRLAWVAPLRAAHILVLVGAAAALTIALLGIYGMLTYFVSLRTKEFGIRMALGATRQQIARLVFDHTLHVMLVGLLAGVLIATLSSRILEHTLVQLMPNGIRTWVVVPLMVLVTGTIAGCIPALRASRVDPNVALRDL